MLIATCTYHINDRQHSTTKYKPHLTKEVLAYHTPLLKRVGTEIVSNLPHIVQVNHTVAPSIGDTPNY